MSRSGPALQATAKEGNALETTQQAPRRQTRADTRFQRESARILGEIKSLDQSTEMLSLGWRDNIWSTWCEIIGKNEEKQGKLSKNTLAKAEDVIHKWPEHKLLYITWAKQSQRHFWAPYAFDKQNRPRHGYKDVVSRAMQHMTELFWRNTDSDGLGGSVSAVPPSAQADRVQSPGFRPFAEIDQGGEETDSEDPMDLVDEVFNGFQAPNSHIYRSSAVKREARDHVRVKAEIAAAATVERSSHIPDALDPDIQVGSSLQWMNARARQFNSGDGRYDGRESPSTDDQGLGQVEGQRDEALVSDHAQGTDLQRSISAQPQIPSGYLPQSCSAYVLSTPSAHAGHTTFAEGFYSDDVLAQAIDILERASPEWRSPMVWLRTIIPHLRNRDDLPEEVSNQAMSLYGTAMNHLKDAAGLLLNWPYLPSSGTVATPGLSINQTEDSSTTVGTPCTHPTPCRLSKRVFSKPPREADSRVSLSIAEGAVHFHRVETAESDSEAELPRRKKPRRRGSQGRDSTVGLRRDLASESEESSAADSSIEASLESTPDVATPMLKKSGKLKKIHRQNAAEQSHDAREKSPQAEEHGKSKNKRRREMEKACRQREEEYDIAEERQRRKEEKKLKKKEKRARDTGGA